MATTATASKIDARTLAELKGFDKKDTHFYVRVCGAKVGTCPTTVGYVAKVTSIDGTRVTYYACKELYSLFQGWQWHVCFASDLTPRIKLASQRIKTYTSLARALTYLNK